MERKSLQASDFSYDLPEHRIAKYPLKDRNRSKLLTYRSGQINEDVFINLNDHLPPNSLLVFNDTKVLSARLEFFKETGARIEVFCLEPFESTVEEALTATQNCRWQCMVGNLKRFKSADTLKMKIAETELSCQQLSRDGQYVNVEFKWEGGIPFSNILDEVGQIPLPPYLNREAEASDAETYQTVYAKRDGAVAAPTAGLHFVPEQLAALEAAGHQLAYLTLYVGAGTFRQVKAEKLVDHNMHSERIVVNQATLSKLADHQGPIIPVGTTSLRSLESLYWLAEKLKAQAITDRNVAAARSTDNSSTLKGMDLGQNDAYELVGSLKREAAFQLLSEALSGTENIDFHSALFIMPAYQWKVIDGLITNFHQPQSTLLALVAALIGEDWKGVYDYALKHDFRFLSYGDSSFLMKKGSEE